MRELATPVEVADDRHLVDTCGTGGDARAYLQRLDLRGLRRRGGRRARWRSTWGARCRRPRAAPTCSRRSARTSRSRPAQIGAGDRQARHRLHVRARAPRRDEARRAGAQGARACARIFNILGPLTNPAGAQEPGDGRVPSRPGRHPGARAAAAGLEARDGGPRPRRPGRDLDLRADAGRRAGEGRDQRVPAASLGVRHGAVRPARDRGAHGRPSRRR